VQYDRDESGGSVGTPGLRASVYPASGYGTRKMAVEAVREVVRAVI